MPARDDDDHDELLQDFFKHHGNDDDEDRDYYKSQNSYMNKHTIQSSSSRSPGSPASRQPIEDALLTLDHKAACYPRELVKTIKRLSSRYAKQGVVVIFILHLHQKNSYDYQTEFTAEDKLLLLQKARLTFQQSVFAIAEQESRENFAYGERNHVFRKIKFVDQRVFAFASDPETAMKWMIRAERAINKVESAKGLVQLSGGCESGFVFETRNDFFGNPVNQASKLAEDIAEPGKLLVSFGDDKRAESKIVENFSMANFDSKRRLMSGDTIYYFVMTDKGISDVGPIECNCFRRENQNEPHQKAPGSTTTVEAKRENIVIVQSDLSGFTKLTKEYHVLHNFTLILHCRRIFKLCMHQLEKKTPTGLFKFEDDKIICKFENPSVALRFVTLVNVQIARYNAGKHQDYQINIKYSIAKGNVLITRDKDIVGKAWDKCCILAEDKAEKGEILATEGFRNTDDSEFTANVNSWGYAFESRRGSGEIPIYYNLYKKD